MQRDASNKSIDRRSTLKLLSSVGAGLTLGTGLGSADPEEEEHSPLKNVPYPDKTYYTYDDSLYKITSHPHILALSDEAIVRHFDSAALEGPDWELARTYVENLRKRYPTKKVRRGNEIRFELSRTALRNLRSERRSSRPLVEDSGGATQLASPQEGGIPSQQTTQDREALKKAVAAFNVKDKNNGVVRPQWEPRHHIKMMDEAADDVNADGDFKDWARHPDDFNKMANGRLGLEDGKLEIDQIPDIVPGKGWVEDKVGSAMKYAIDRLGKNYTQFYNASYIEIPVPLVSNIKIGDVGMAPEAASVFYTLSKNAWSSSDKRRFAAYASHYIQDMGVPLHTGMAVQQAGLVWQIDVETGWGGIPTGIDFDYEISGVNRWLHYGYEALVHNRWDDTLKYHFSGNDTASFSDPASAAKSVAEVSNQYSSDIFHTIYENETCNCPGRWDDDETIEPVLQGISNCLSVAGDYNRELLVQVGLGEEPGCPYPPRWC